MRLTPAVLLFVSACAQFPELDSTATPGVATAPYPQLMPLESLLNAPDPRATPTVQAGVEARAAALRARAARLSGPVVDTRTKARMGRGVTGAS